MSPSLGSTSSYPMGHKKRKLQGACDICKHKKIRCDSAEMPGNICSNCIAFGSKCTHAAKKYRRGATDPSQPHVTSEKHNTLSTSQSRESIRRILSDECQGDNSLKSTHPLVNAILSSNPFLDFATQHSLMTLSQYVLGLEQELLLLKQSTDKKRTDYNIPQPRTSESPIPQPQSQVTTDVGSPVTTDDDDDLAEHLKQVTIASSETRHFGSSSSMSLLETAMRIGHNSQRKQILGNNVLGTRRPQFWNLHPWEVMRHEDIPIHEFPEHDLLQDLIGLYFEQVNIHFPFLHRPTFQRSIAGNLHLMNPQFGAVVLGLCAVASRYSNDSRVLLEGDQSRHSSGWKWFRQIQLFPKSFLPTPSLYELQTNCLATLYLHGTSQPEACWLTVSMGIRYAQDVGAHRKKSNCKPSVESEMWKRTFWVLVCIDTIVCSFVGRPRATTSEDYDVDLPIDCDDEYWENEDPDLAFVQPPGELSTISSFIAYLKLMMILEYAQRTVYSLKKPRIGSVDQSDQQAVENLDSELNKWIDSLPDFLKWESCKQGTIFFDQSTMLHIAYHHTRIFVHRPFIPLPTKPSPLPFPSLAICTNAARSCVGVLKARSRSRSVYLPFPHIQFALLTSATILLLNYWNNSKTSRIPREPNDDVKSAQECLNALRKLEDRWIISGRLCDVLRGLFAFGGVPFVWPSAPEGKTEGDNSRYTPPAPVWGPYNESLNSQGCPPSAVQPWWDMDSLPTTVPSHRLNTAGALDTIPRSFPSGERQYNHDLIHTNTPRSNLPPTGTDLFASANVITQAYLPPYVHAQNLDEGDLANMWLYSTQPNGWVWGTGGL